MITRDELREAAREFQLDINVVEKDYALGWLLAGIAAHPELRETWIFKGGTCLKKCWFETYRFSEDLDFTLRDKAHLDQNFLAQTFDEVGEWIYEQSGIELPREARVFEIFTNPRGHRAGQGRIGYRGPNARIGGTPRIKLDLAADELLVLEPVWRQIHHPYSDALPDGMKVLCYAFEEVFAEKLRALAERQRPRDLYDVIHLHRRIDLGPDRRLLRDVLGRKCEFKGIGVPTMALLNDRPERQAIEVEWEQMLAHQLPVCPPFVEFWNELPQVFDWLVTEVPLAVLPSIGSAIGAPAGGLDLAWSAPPMAERWGYTTPLEAIRFAGTNRLLVDLDYETERGDRSRRTIEPYALRRTQADELLLYAVKSESGETRSYRVDRIRGATVLQRPFRPRFAVELTSRGPVTALAAAQGPTVQGSAIARPRRAATRPATNASRYGGKGGPTYVYECALCHKKFNRRTMDATLNPHKDPRGWDCPGRTGLYKTTKY